MDPNHISTSTTNQDQNDSKTTTTTDDEPDQSTEMGSVRSYECVFCKRGFTTAQALGGHMNIHRKDRVKTKPNTPSKPEPFDHHYPSTLRPTTTTLITTSSSHHQSFQTYFPTSSTWCLASTTTTTSSTTPPHDHQFPHVHNNNNRPQILNVFKENWTNIALASRSSPAPTNRRDKRSDGNDDDDDDDSNGGDELDLELRLGHDR